MRTRRIKTHSNTPDQRRTGGMMNHPSLELLPVCQLKPYARNGRVHSKKQIQQIADSIRRFGFTNPVLVDNEGTILAGHARVAAAKLLGMEFVPCLRMEHLSPAEKRAYVIADNKLALNARWDEEILAEELTASSAKRAAD